MSYDDDITIEREVNNIIAACERRKRDVKLKFCPDCCETIYEDLWNVDDNGKPVQCQLCGWRADMEKLTAAQERQLLREKPCECCGKRPGETNSDFLRNSPQSTHDCGDWVCYECEEAAREDFENGDLWPGCLHQGSKQT